MALWAMTLLGGVAQAQEMADNPIDQAFAADLNTGRSTYELNYVTSEYCKAWKAELEHVGDVLKGQYVFDADKEKIEAYVAAVKQLSKHAGAIERLNWSDTTMEPAGRHVGTGATSAGLLAQARTYKEATLFLIQTYGGNNPKEKESYQYSYIGQGVDWAAVRKAAK
jgi:hypothetical protein